MMHSTGLVRTITGEIARDVFLFLRIGSAHRGPLSEGASFPEKGAHLIESLIGIEAGRPGKLLTPDSEAHRAPTSYQRVTAKLLRRYSPAEMIEKPGDGLLGLALCFKTTKSTQKHHSW
jgi:hypothetical protein